MDLTNITPDQTIDTCGLSCPMPLLKTKKALKGLKSGQILEILGTDPGSKNDIPDFGAKKRQHIPGHGGWRKRCHPLLYSEQLGQENR
ncbi:response regulator, SirA family [Desulfosarcina variabilis str. Montpellier]|uniref:sulfurtransferase TusA family protein n=1 Tax=Desulfosarcina variabilis TaxID=2300 RepID=UPI003AFA7D93